jgi:hypothetical protein
VCSCRYIPRVVGFTSQLTGYIASTPLSYRIAKQLVKKIVYKEQEVTAKIKIRPNPSVNFGRL